MSFKQSSQRMRCSSVSKTSIYVMASLIIIRRRFIVFQIFNSNQHLSDSFPKSFDSKQISLLKVTIICLRFSANAFFEAQNLLAKNQHETDFSYVKANNSFLLYSSLTITMTTSQTKTMQVSNVTVFRLKVCVQRPTLDYCKAYLLSANIESRIIAWLC